MEHKENNDPVSCATMPCHRKKERYREFVVVVKIEFSPESFI